MKTTDDCKSGKRKKEPWLMPVTKAFYEKIRLKGEYAVRKLGCGSSAICNLMKVIDAYLLQGKEPHYGEWEWILSFFYSVQSDIDVAIERRRRCRERAAERKARKEAAIAEAQAKEAVENEVVEPETVVENFSRPSGIADTDSGIPIRDSPDAALTNGRGKG